MRYFIDTVCFLETLNKIKSGTAAGSFFITDTIYEEINLENIDSLMSQYNISIVNTDIETLWMTKKIMTSHGDNENLISIYGNKGSGDVSILASILKIQEKEQSSGRLFGYEDDMVIITKDKGLSEVAKIYGIKTVESI